MVGWFYRTFVDANVASYLVDSEGEEVLDEINRHWMAYRRAALEVAVAVAFLVLLALGSPSIGWLFILVAVGVTMHAGWLACQQKIERVVITNHRIFRVWGPVNRQVASIPINKVLDISFQKPPLGRLTGYCHFVFESAAQDQGLREVRYVPKPDQRHYMIQWVLQRSGVRASVRLNSNVNDWK